jgi:hypothetical protein
VLSKAVMETYETWITLTENVVEATNCLSKFVNFFPSALEYAKSISDDLDFEM